MRGTDISLCQRLHARPACVRPWAELNSLSRYLAVRAASSRQALAASAPSDGPAYDSEYWVCLDGHDAGSR